MGKTPRLADADVEGLSSVAIARRRRAELRSAWAWLDSGEKMARTRLPTLTLLQQPSASRPGSAGGIMRTADSASWRSVLHATDLGARRVPANCDFGPDGYRCPSKSLAPIYVLLRPFGPFLFLILIGRFCHP